MFKIFKKDEIRVDLLSFCSCTIAINLNFNNKTFDFVFINIIDYPQYSFKFISEIERVRHCEVKIA